MSWSEWDYRAPTLAEQVSDAQAHWDGPRCPHGMALLPFGPDVICGSCEAEAHEEAMYHLECEQHDRTGRWRFPLGPDRWEVGLREPGEPALVGGDPLADDVPW